MATCSYCDQPASVTIVSDPQRVCIEHALEFWTGLLAYASLRSATCVKQERLCTCPSCEEWSASQLRSVAIASVGPSPGDHERFPMRLAS